MVHLKPMLHVAFFPSVSDRRGGPDVEPEGPRPQAEGAADQELPRHQDQAAAPSRHDRAQAHELHRRQVGETSGKKLSAANVVGKVMLVLYGFIMLHYIEDKSGETSGNKLTGASHASLIFLLYYNLNFSYEPICGIYSYGIKYWERSPDHLLRCIGYQHDNAMAICFFSSSSRYLRVLVRDKELYSDCDIVIKR